MSKNERGFSIAELMTVMTIIGVLAGIAIPTLLKYVKRTKTSEAAMNVRKLFDGSTTYFATEYSTPDGSMSLAAFPASTPAKPTCCVGSTRTVLNDWDDDGATWTALSFAIGDPFYYSYQYDSSGTENSAAFTIAAFGDLDDDGLAATFVRFGTVTAFEVRGSEGMYIAHETE
jgi:prepilin-type N-terminal cleavage/methylation domain-containing protein